MQSTMDKVRIYFTGACYVISVIIVLAVVIITLIVDNKKTENEKTITDNEMYILLGSAVALVALGTAVSWSVKEEEEIELRREGMMNMNQEQGPPSEAYPGLDTSL